MGEVTRTRLDKLATEIRADVDFAEASWRNAVRYAIAAGEKLIEAKGLLKHGKWLPWLEENFEFTDRTAQRYMDVARNATRVSDLPTMRDAIALLTNPTPQTMTVTSAPAPESPEPVRFVVTESEPAQSMPVTSAPAVHTTPIWKKPEEEPDLPWPGGEEITAPEEEPEEVLGQVVETGTSGQEAEPEPDENEVEEKKPDWPVEHQIGQYTLRDWGSGAQLGDYTGKGTISIRLNCAACETGDVYYEGFDIDCEPQTLTGGLNMLEWAWETFGWTLTDDGRLLCPDHQED
jgi:hypothetical protein